MTEVLHANIFFVIASIGVVLFIILLCVAFYHVIKVIRSVRRIVERVEAGSEMVADDLRDLRENLSPTRLFSMFLKMTGMGPVRRRKRRNVSEEDEE
ncbi:MAG: hypothetical protein WDZ93_00065 [Candidatus Paceibacterota bacterium]